MRYSMDRVIGDVNSRLRWGLCEQLQSQLSVQIHDILFWELYDDMWERMCVNIHDKWSRPLKNEI